jgi:hypothetical protein
MFRGATCLAMLAAGSCWLGSVLLFLGITVSYGDGCAQYSS